MTESPIENTNDRVVSQLFLSYKREDEARAGRLARELERAGFSVWWDRSLLGAESWRVQIEQALAQSRLVIVCWSHGSVGETGDFVRDEAARAKSEGKLVPIFLDRVSPPLGFGELQAIDLAHWRGAPGDVFFQDLTGLIAARLEGRVPPKPKGPMMRLRRRLTWGSAATVAVTGLVVFALNLLHVQEAFCAASVLQPALGDACGALHLGSSPTRAERLAWLSHPRGSCEALRQHLRAFPEGAYRARSMSLLSGRRVVREETWAPQTRHPRLFVPADGAELPSAEAALGDAMARGLVMARQICQGYVESSGFALVDVRVQPGPGEALNSCSRSGSGYVCSLGGSAVCGLKSRQVSEREMCSEAD